MVYGLRDLFTVANRGERERETDYAVGPARQTVLILSGDAVGAALVAALVETLGYRVRFLVPPESTDEALRRVGPAVAMVDCEDPSIISPELIGRARMRGVSVLLFGSAEAVRGVQALATQFDLHRLIMPATAEHLGESLLKAIG